MKLTHAVYLTVTTVAMSLAHSANAQDTRTVLLRFRRAGDTTVAIRNAQVLVDHTIDAVTDSTGVARLAGLEDGTHIVEAVAPDYEPFFDNFASGPGIRIPIDLEIRVAVAIAKPKGQPTELLVAGFAKRRALGQGKFFTLVQLKAANGRPLANFLKVDAGAFIASGPRNESYLSSRTQLHAVPPCYATVVRDGLRIYPFEGVNPPDLDKIFTDDVASVEFYPAIAPTGVGTASKCGALVLWSRP